MDGRVCAWCRGPIPLTRRHEARTYCSKGCRQAAFRIRARRLTMEKVGRPLRFAYADPPFPGLAWRYYGRESTYAGEVDHAKLIAFLLREFPDGWALSTSEDALREVLPLCPRAAHLCPWVKPIGVSPQTYGLHTSWEALIVVGGRAERPGVRDWLRAMPARGGGSLPGRKPLAFCAFLFEALGMRLGDELVDLFPGTGIVSRAWAELSRRPPATLRGASLVDDSDASRGGLQRRVLLPSSTAGNDASHEVLSDASLLEDGDAWGEEDPREVGLRELCVCSHDRGDHLVGDGACEGGEGGALCTCPMYEAVPAAVGGA